MILGGKSYDIACKVTEVSFAGILSAGKQQQGRWSVAHCRQQSAIQ